MNNSLLRMVAGYSRLALQEERKHQNVVGQLFHTNAYRRFIGHARSLEGQDMGSEHGFGFQKLKIPNFIHKLT